MNFGLQGGPVAQLKAEFGSQARVVSGSAEQAPAGIAGAERLFFDANAKYWVAPVVAEGEHVTSKTWRGMPVLVIVLAGGFVVNFLWCLFLNAKNKTGGDYVNRAAPLVANLFFAGLAGAIWCSQFICLKTGEPAMGEMAYIGFAVLMATPFSSAPCWAFSWANGKAPAAGPARSWRRGCCCFWPPPASARYSGYQASAAKTAAVPADSLAVAR